MRHLSRLRQPSCSCRVLVLEDPPCFRFTKSMNQEKLAKLQAQVWIGGKGTARRKVVVHRTATADDKKLEFSKKNWLWIIQLVLKRSCLKFRSPFLPLPFWCCMSVVVITSGEEKPTFTDHGEHAASLLDCDKGSFWMDHEMLLK